MANALPQSNDEQQFPDTPRGWGARWAVEMKAARKWLASWHERGDSVVRRFLDDRNTPTSKDNEAAQETRVNLFTANIQTLMAMLYAKAPTVDVTRRFDDFGDQLGRVAGVILERVLNDDMERPADSFKSALHAALSDRLLPGLGVVRLRYTRDEQMGEETPAKIHPDTGEELAPVVPAQMELVSEDVETEYVHYRDFLWSPTRTWSQARWASTRAQMTRLQINKKFGEDIGNKIPLGSKRSGPDSSSLDANRQDPWGRADVWEIWDKEHKCQWFYVEGYPEVLVPVDLADEANPNGSLKDPYELDGFWPWPEPLAANTTTSKFVPVPDFCIAQDLYNAIDVSSTRIALLKDALRAVGVYDKTAGSSVGKMLDGRAQNKLYPVDSWAAFAERGGVKGAIDWLPLDQIVEAMDKLREMRTEDMGLLFQVTGWSDIMRGQAAEQTTATEQAIKAKFASVRVQTMQEQFARFAGEAQAIKSQLISKFFEPQTFIERSNIEQTPDAAMASQAVAFLKGNTWGYRVEVKPESVSLTDYAALKQESLEIMQGLGTFFQTMMPGIQMLGPAMGPIGLQFVMKAAQWFMSRLKGAGTLEGLFDQTLTQATQAMQRQAMNPQQAHPPDPKVMAQQMKTKGDLMQTQMESQARMKEIAAETQSNVTTEAVKAQMNLRVAEGKERAKALNAVNDVTSSGPA